MGPRPTLRGAGALAAVALIVVLAATTDTPEVAPLAVVAGVPLLVAPWLAHRRASRALELAAFHAHTEPATVEVGAPMEFVLSLTSRATQRLELPRLGLPSVESRWLSRGTQADPGARPLRFAPSESRLVALPTPGAGRTRSCRLPVPTGRRAVLELPPLRSWAYDPFGLFGSPGPVTPAVRAVIHPIPLDPCQPITGLGATRAGFESAQFSSSGRGLGDLEGIRPYVAGDRLNLLHWPAKARYGTWFVRQFGTEGTAAVPLVFDDRAGVHRKADFERLVSSMLWALDEAIEAGHPVNFLTLSGKSFTLEPSEQGRAMASLVLAEIQPSPSRPRWLPIPADSVLLTTRTGARRLTQLSGPGSDLAKGEASLATGVTKGQVVVV